MKNESLEPEGSGGSDVLGHHMVGLRPAARDCDPSTRCVDPAIARTCVGPPDSSEQNQDQNKTARKRAVLVLVGLTGFEPATP